MKYECVIQGAGLVGSMFAALYACENQNSKVLLLDRAQLSPKDIGDQGDYALRVSAINAFSQELFTKLGLDKKLLALRHGCFDAVKVFTCDGELYLDKNNVSLSNLALVYENRLMLKVLHDYILNECKNIEFMQDEVSDIKHDVDSESIMFVSGKKVGTKLLVAADGGQSSIRRLLGADVMFKPHNQSAIVANIYGKSTRDNFAQQTFYPDGILAWLPLDKPNTYSIVWSQSSYDCDSAMACSDDEFIAKLHQVDKSGIYEKRLLGERASFPLCNIHVEDYFKCRTVLLGDAAHVIHPLAGQGLNLGFADAAELVSALKYQNNITHALKDFQSRRRVINTSTQKLMNLLKFSFNDKAHLFNLLKENFMSALNRSNKTKAAMLEIANGSVN